MERRWSTIDTIAAVLVPLGAAILIAAWVIVTTTDRDIPGWIWVLSSGLVLAGIVLFAVSLITGTRAPGYLETTWPYRDGAQYMKLARSDGADFGYAVARVVRKRPPRRAADEGVPDQLKRGGVGVTYCYPNHFPAATTPPQVGKYRVRWSVSPFDDHRLLRRRAGRRVATTKFEITEADHQAALDSASSGNTPEPHDPEKDYGGSLSHEVFGEGRFRVLGSGLNDVGNGWDRGVQLEIVCPPGRLMKVGGWQNLDSPEMRRLAAQGGGVHAESPGQYIIRWRNIPAPAFASEVIDEKTITLGPTGPREGWRAWHEKRRGEIVFHVEQLSRGREALNGFRCDIYGPGGPFEADDRALEKTLGPPRPKGEGSFQFPEDFPDAPTLHNLRDGDYEVCWTAWEESDESGSQGNQLDVARDAFHVARDGSIE